MLCPIRTLLLEGVPGALPSRHTLSRIAGVLPADVEYGVWGRLSRWELDENTIWRLRSPEGFTCAGLSLINFFTLASTSRLLAV